jgi:hypothetical protein
MGMDGVGVLELQYVNVFIVIGFQQRQQQQQQQQLAIDGALGMCLGAFVAT